MKALISSVVSSHHRALSSQSIIGHLLYCQLGDSLRRQLLTSPQGRPGPWQISEEQCLFSLSFLASGFLERAKALAQILKGQKQAFKGRMLDVGFSLCEAGRN